MVFVFLVFVKQKTAYEMRISDWSSDVCSSDFDINGTTISATNGSVAKLRQLAVLANVTYDIPLGGNTFKPYVGVGLGAVGSHLKALGEDDGSVRLAWQPRPGAAAKVKIGRASLGERGGEYIEMLVVGVT